MNGTARAQAYRDMIDLLEQGHIKRSLKSSRGFCLVGAANEVAGPIAGMELQREIVQEIASRNPTLIAPLARLYKTTPEQLLTLKGQDGGLFLIENWNDTPFRRTKKVVALLQELAERCEAGAKDELIAELTATINDLKTQYASLQAYVRSLEEENARLSDEVSFWRRSFHARRAAKSAAALTAASAELAELDKELSSTLEHLAEV
jgi:cell division protein FtsB